VERDPESRKPWIPASAGMTGRGRKMGQADLSRQHVEEPLAFEARVVQLKNLENKEGGL